MGWPGHGEVGAEAEQALGVRGCPGVSGKGEEAAEAEEAVGVRGRVSGEGEVEAETEEGFWGGRYVGRVGAGGLGEGGVEGRPLDSTLSCELCKNKIKLKLVKLMRRGHILPPQKVMSVNHEGTRTGIPLRDRQYACFP